MAGQGGGSSLHITSRTRVEDVMEMANFDDLGWKRFLHLTLDQVKAQVAESEQTLPSWPALPYLRKVAMHQELNERLQAEGLPKVDSKVFHWRMEKLWSSRVREAKRGMTQEASASESSSDAAQANHGDAATIALPSIRDNPDLARYLTNDPTETSQQFSDAS
ncbi:hypothetical protein BST61_g2965 [Cercospora zeina]